LSLPHLTLIRHKDHPLTPILFIHLSPAASPLSLYHFTVQLVKKMERKYEKERKEERERWKRI